MTWRGDGLCANSIADEPAAEKLQDEQTKRTDESGVSDGSMSLEEYASSRSRSVRRCSLIVCVRRVASECESVVLCARGTLTSLLRRQVVPGGSRG